MKNENFGIKQTNSGKGMLLPFTSKIQIDKIN